MRIDGSMSLNKRADVVRQFHHDPEASISWCRNMPSQRFRGWESQLPHSCNRCFRGSLLQRLLLQRPTVELRVGHTSETKARLVQVRVLLCSTKAGGVGLNLTCASR